FRRFRQIRWMSDLRTHRLRIRAAFVNADVVEAWPLRLQFWVKLVDEFKSRVGHLLVVMPPLSHGTGGIVINLCRIGYVVAFPRVRLVFLDLLSNVFEVALPHV